MNGLRSPVVRLLILVALIVMIFSMPAREFLKVTFIMGIPAIILLGLMSKRPRWSPGWIISCVLLLGVVGAYAYLLTGLPDRIETRRIISEGGALVAEGKYDQAIAEYRKLEKLGKEEAMQERINTARQEKLAAEKLNQAQDLLRRGERDEAIKVLDGIPGNTRAGRQAEKLRPSWQ